jgi:hypothetical protein
MAEAIEYSVVTIVKLVADRVGMIRTWQVFDTLRGGSRLRGAWAVRAGSDTGSEESLGIIGNGRVTAFVQSGRKLACQDPRGEVGDNVNRVSAVSVGNCKQATNVV